MGKSETGKDLFGRRVRQRRPRYEGALERHDKATLKDRAERVRLLAKITPRMGLALPTETFLIFEEARACFVCGNYVATTLLAVAFIEHWLVSMLSSRGCEKEAAKGLAACIKAARREKLIDTVLTDKADQLRQIRNPFVHLKSVDNSHSVVGRLRGKSFNVQALLADDAQEALRTMYGIVLYSHPSD